MNKDHRAVYADQIEKAKRMWVKPWADVLKADVWYNRNRNKICLDMLEDIGRNKRILSVGSWGWVERELLEAIPASEIVRTDLIGDPNDDVLEASAESLPFDSESFGIVICRDVIEHVEDAHKAFLEMRRVLVERGYLLITTPNIYVFPMNELNDGLHIRGYSPDGFLKELKEYGLEVVSKRGNAPGMMRGLIGLYYDGHHHVLNEFAIIAEKVSHFPDSYYIGTQLFVLARKL